MHPTMKFRKKSVVIEARQFTEEDVADARRLKVGRTALEQWCGGGIETFGSILRIQTLEGATTADIGDWIIKGVKGEFYPCKPDIFEQAQEAQEIAMLGHPLTIGGKE